VPAATHRQSNGGHASLCPPYEYGFAIAPYALSREHFALSGALCYSVAERTFEARMSVDNTTVRRIAHLARIAVADDEVEHLRGELNAMLAFVEQLNEVDVTGVEPMTSVTPMEMKMRDDVVTDGGIADDIVKNAPETQDHYFVVPKVVE
jgi:aspartyl-tRNA(Asn)/glutamyl-tRNA(Gln) amidotransferase subunit C